MHFVITSEQDVCIDGIGMLKSGEPKEVSADELKLFQVMNGVSLPKARFPSSVSVECIVLVEKDKEV